MRNTALAAASLFVLVALPALAAEKPVALAGTVSSAAEGKMEGVVVTAQQLGSPISVSVVSDENGHYAFPANHLGPGRYSLAIRAVGYDLDGAPAADVAKGKTATLDLTLDKTRNLAVQLTNAEWMMSIPGTEQQKAQLLNCDGCHTLQRVVMSTHDANEWANTIPRMMHYTFQSQPIRPIPRVDPTRGGTPDMYRQLAAYLATINLSKSDTWSYPLKTLPRPKGRDTHVIVTEYQLPRPTIQPHDVIIDRRGIAWYSDFGEMKLGRLDPRTGKVTEYDTPDLRTGYPPGSLDLEADPKNGNLWIAMMYQAGLAEFDPAKRKFVKTLEIPPAMQNLDTQPSMLGVNYNADGEIWTNNAGDDSILRVNVKTGKWQTFFPLKALPGSGNALYGIASDAKNNLYFADFGIRSNYIGRIDAKTGAVTYYATPTLNSRPRRLEFDKNGKLWFAEYGGNAVGMLDPKTGEIREWKMQTPYTAPYYVTTDKNGEIWTGGMSTDRVVRINPLTGETVEYLMPGDTNMRRVFVDNSTTPVTFWTGANHSATIVRVQPLD